jgi:hypothetical protein
MLTYKGKYNSINIMADTIEEELIQKIYLLLNHPAFAHSYLAGMADAHDGVH